MNGLLLSKHIYILASIIILIYFIYKEIFIPTLSFLIIILLLLITHTITPNIFLSSFANESIAILFMLLVIYGAIKETNIIYKCTNFLFCSNLSYNQFLFRLTLFTISASAFINNAPIVAILMPAVISWGSKKNIASSKLLIPLAYSAVLGGTITLFGTSTNLIANSFLNESNLSTFSIFDLMYVGLPLAIIDSIYIIIASNKLLPQRTTITTNTIIKHINSSNFNKENIYFIGSFLFSCLIKYICNLNLFTSLLLFTICLLITNITNIQIIKSSFNLNLLLIATCAITLGKAIQHSGLANHSASLLIKNLHNLNLLYLLIIIFLATNILAILINSTSAISIIIPIVITLTQKLQIDPEPLLLCAIYAASASFMNPFGNYANLINFSSGNYKFIDFIKTGLPLNIIYMGSCITLIYFLY